MRGTPMWIFIVTLLGGLLLAREIRQGALRPIDEAFLDWLTGSARTTLQPGPVTVVAIDDTALATGHPWPWSPLDYAVFAKAAEQTGAGLAVIQPVLDWSETDSRLEGILLDRLLALPKVVLAARLGDAPGEDRAPVKMERLPVLSQVMGDPGPIPEFRAVTAAPPNDFQLAFATGLEAPPAPPGSAPVKTVPLLYRVRGEIVPSLPLQTLMHLLKITPDEVFCELGSHAQLGSRHRIPIDAGGGLLLDWRLVEAVRTLSYDALIELAQEGETARVDPPLPEGGTLLLGRTDRDAERWRLADGKSGSLVEITAAVASAVLQRHFPERSGPILDYLLVLVVALLGRTLFKLQRRAATPLFFVAIPLYALGSLAVFEQHLVWSPFALPVFLLASVVILRLLWPGRLTSGSPPRNEDTESIANTP